MNINPLAALRTINSAHRSLDSSIPLSADDLHKTGDAITVWYSAVGVVALIICVAIAAIGMSSHAKNEAEFIRSCTASGRTLEVSSWGVLRCS